MADPSFDIVSKVDRQEVDNALNQAAKEAATRYDFKGTGAEIAWSGDDAPPALTPQPQAAPVHVDALARDVQRLTARHQRAHPRRDRQQRGDVDCGGRDLLEVVEHEQGRAVGEHRAGVAGLAEACATAGSTSCGSRTAASGTK